MIAMVAEPADLRAVEVWPLLSGSAQPRIQLIQSRPKLKYAHIPKLVYAIALMVLRTFCLDMRWNGFAQKISEHKFLLFPGLRRWQIDKWVGTFQRQRLFPNATESELRDRAKELVSGFMI